MKKSILLFSVLLIVLGCEEVVDVDLPTEEPKFVIEATGVRQEQDSLGSLSVKLSKTAPFFQDSIPRVGGAEVSVEWSNQSVQLTENPEDTGFYVAVIPMVYDENYTLTVKDNGETYQGSTQLKSSVPVDDVTQEEGIFDSDDTRIKAYFSDPADEENYYYFRFTSKHGVVLNYSDDEFFDGNQFSTSYTDEFDTGDVVDIQIQGTSAGFNQYIGKVLGQSQGGGNPFATAPATIRGNMVNLTHEEKFPLGYFRMSQEFTATYTVE